MVIAPVAVHDSHAYACGASADDRSAPEQRRVGDVNVEALHERQGVLGAVQNAYL